MATIIKRGAMQDPSKLVPYSQTITCPQCQCEFRLEPGDEWARHEDQREGIWIELWCPEPQCAHRITSPFAGKWSEIADPNWRPASE